MFFSCFGRAAMPNTLFFINYYCAALAIKKQLILLLFTVVRNP